MNVSKNPFESKVIHRKTNFKKKKVYLTLGACAAVLSVAAWSTYMSVKDYFNPQEVNSKPQVSKKNISVPESTYKDVSNSKSLTPSKAEEKQDSTMCCEEENCKQDEEEIQVASTNIKDLEIVYPSTEEIIKDFSDGKPMYSKTFSDWRVHDGVDFKANLDSDIKAITSGKVKNIYLDANYGTTVVIEHDGNFTAYYCGLSENTLVQKDQRVNVGDTVGKLSVASCECCDEPHFHFMIFKDEKFIDPMLVLDKEL